MRRRGTSRIDRRPAGRRVSGSRQRDYSVSVVDPTFVTFADREFLTSTSVLERPVECEHRGNVRSVKSRDGSCQVGSGRPADGVVGRSFILNCKSG